MIHKLVDHETEKNGTTIYRMRWYAHGSEEITWEPTQHVPRTKTFQYCNGNKLPLPKNIHLEEVG